MIALHKQERFLGLSRMIFAYQEQFLGLYTKQMNNFLNNETNSFLGAPCVNDHQADTILAFGFETPRILILAFRKR